MLSKSDEYFYNLECEKSLILAKKALSEAYKINDQASISRAYNIIALNFQEYLDVKQASSYFAKALKHANL